MLLGLEASELRLLRSPARSKARHGVRQAVDGDAFGIEGDVL
ncbi:hypothetical protein [Streptomyces avidinii]|uniref:Uncharacterized protein n=1 Tax=Streptomyces avidinii TaxID=1895 RepID=A0ABS4LHE9_STRAV|nr:hypothetical protein [Streptomyces avidinii]